MSQATMKLRFRSRHTQVSELDFVCPILSSNHLCASTTVYSHHLFVDEEFQSILAAIRADSLGDEVAENVYLEELLEMELEGNSDQEV